MTFHNIFGMVLMKGKILPVTLVAYGLKKMLDSIQLYSKHNFKDTHHLYVLNFKNIFHQF